MKKEIVFGAAEVISPDFAAKLAHVASMYEASVYLNCNGSMFCVDSLIGMLAMDLRRGMAVTVSAEGTDAEEAVEAISKMLIEQADNTENAE